tara:strand:- start:13005 stop:13508 length:504 start_codon:yes stop_codon:yes gene_type:complete
MTLQTTTYCTAVEVERLISQAAIRQFGDHGQDDKVDLNVLHDHINKATNFIDLYLRSRYTAANLATSDLVNDWAITLSAHYLSMTRGNPGIYDEQFAEIKGYLEALHAETMGLPGITKDDEEASPSMSNLTVDRSYNRNTIRVTPTNSSNLPTDLVRHNVNEYGGDN